VQSQRILIPPIKLCWSEWVSWDALKRDACNDPVAVSVPSASGVYEVRQAGEEQRLTIGKANNLRMRIKQGLVKGKAQYSTGEKIRRAENTGGIVVRWALTDRPSAVEEELHKQHVARCGSLPRYTDRT
jgi:hypothetical protein